MRKLIFVLLAIAIIVVVALNSFSDKTYHPEQIVSLKEKFSEKPPKIVDHSKFAVLQKKFKTPQEVTKTCISCHTERHKEVMATSHWQWERPDYIARKGIVYLGKRNIINNFCIGVQTSVKSCAKCHIGYDMKEDGSSYKKPENVDCLVCHDNSNTYVKGPNMAGNPAPSVDLTKVAQSVGRTSRDNCGVCHFYGGGGNAVKHGDLDNSMFHPDRKIDVHMDEAGPNLVCSDCHKTENHVIAGRLYSIATTNTKRAACEDCHTSTPHAESILNEHTVKVACQTCHIPIYSKERSTNLYWDWSTAGELRDGKPFMEEDSLGNHIYKSIKGSFTYGRKLVPDYVWFNGTADHYLLGDEVQDTTKPVVLNPLHGSYADGKIIPVKIHITNQPFDPVTKLIIQPHLYADKKGEGAYWKDFDWNAANKSGMEAIGLPYSGKYTFIKTKMYWPLNHQVSPEDEALKCTDCHTRENSRLAGLTDFYMPGRDANPWVDNLGVLILLLTLVGVLGHGALRIYFTRKQK
jgi:octaheme c-type cytochrome (tetrathionate reductase family)